MNNQTVLVTGGTGFLGVNIILELLKKGFTVRTTLRTLSRKNEILDALQQVASALLISCLFMRPICSPIMVGMKQHKVVIMSFMLLPHLWLSSPKTKMS